MTRSRPGRGKGRLPAETTPFVNRDADVAAVKRLLGAARLVTLTGVGGTGKTRLATRVAADLRSTFADGAWLVDLTTVTEPRWLDLAVAEALGIDEPEAVTGYLAGRELLLVLDNCEHVLDACARFAESALRRAPRLRLLCTSRQPLGMASEHVWEIPPLALPDRDGRLSADTAPRSAAIALFVARAAAVVSGFALTPENVDTVADICTRLDGLPLAIELAAAQLRMRTIDQLASGLGSGFRMLTARQATPRHHRSLKATFDWSYALCSPEEQELWVRLSVFHQSFSAEAAEYVCGGDRSRDEVVELLSGLLDKSVLVRENGAGPVRYRLLETVRRYGLERLGFCAELSRRHLDWYLRLARQFDADWFGPGQPEALRRMHREHANLRAALEFSLGAPEDAAAGLELATCLREYWLMCGQSHAGRYWLKRLLERNPEPTRARADALVARCMIAVIRGDPAVALAEARRVAELARGLGDPRLVADGRRLLGMAALLRNDLPAARELLALALAEDTVLDNGVGAVQARLALATAALLAGDPARAAGLAERSRAFCESRGEQVWLCRSLCAAAHAALRSGDLSAAARYAHRATELAGEVGSIVILALAVERSGGIAGAQGDHVRAARLLGAADQMWQRLGRPVFAGVFGWRADATCEAEARAALGDTGFRAEFRRGAAMRRDTAVGYALGASDAVTTTAVPALAPHLTPRERQVAALVAEGLSNRQIAHRLGTSQRTAESHVENILRKLAFTARTQIAAWVVQRAV
jgi:predicted ATPase/DNA-binding CsgD family transcriptional regulator